MDFGISLLLGARRVTFTQLANPIGTPDYASPEQVSGLATDERSDIYAMGIILYEMLSGCVPFEGENPLSVVAQRVMRDPPHIRAICPGLSEQLDYVVFKASRLDPLLRYQSAYEMRYDLDHLPQVSVQEPDIAPPPILEDGLFGISRRSWIKGLALLAALVALAIALDVLRKAGWLP
jgi:eukaryotic-like serine/threonine-protein kinase